MKKFKVEVIVQINVEVIDKESAWKEAEEVVSNALTDTTSSYKSFDIIGASVMEEIR